jgi:hypothetical protein
MAPAEFEPVIPESERPQFHALDRAAPGIAFITCTPYHILFRRTAQEVCDGWCVWNVGEAGEGHTRFRWGDPKE